MRKVDTTTRRRVRRSSKFRIFPLLVVFIFVLIFPIGLQLWVKVKIDSLNYKLSALEEERKNLMAEVMQLRVERAALISPEKVKREAEALGLRRPKDGQIIILK